MLATLPSQEPSLKLKDYVYEPKVDGIRAIVEVLPAQPAEASARRRGSPKAAVRLWSRNGNEKTAQFPDVVDGVGTWLKKITAPIVLDGEVVALDEEGRPASFQRIQHRIHVTVPGFNSKKQILSPEEQPVAFVAFDLLRDGDRDLRNLCLFERREFLEALLKKYKPPTSDLVRLTSQTIGDGTALKKQAEAENWEGLMVKLSRSPYRAGRRSPEWIKLKLTKQDEFVICGWTDPGGTRMHFGSLILGAQESSGLQYVGEVGTGFKGSELDRLMAMLKRIESPASPFDPPPKLLSAKGRPHWVKPILVAQIRYTEITDDGRLRHPAYLGLRDDKLPAEVKLPAPSASAAKGRSGATAAPEQKLSAAEIDSLIDQLNFLEKARKNGRLKLPNGDDLEVTNLHKIFWPAIKKTKGDLIRHYVRMAPYILPVVDNRPLVMKRMPNGADQPFFYQHRAPEPVPPGVRIETLPDDDVPARLVGGSLKTLLYMAQLASISDR